MTDVSDSPKPMTTSNLEVVRALRIGYAPYDSTLTRPGDRRRFVYYAKQRGLNFEVAKSDESYDVVIASAGADLTEWSRYRKGAVVYDYVDAYLEVASTDLKGIFRGPAKYIFGQNKYFYMRYSRAIEDLCRRADAVICSTVAQQRRMKALCPQTEVILDFHFDDARQTKQCYSAGPIFNLVWEGLGGNLPYVRSLSRVLRKVAKDYPIALHAVTNLEYGAYLGWKVGKKTTLREAKRIFEPTYLYQWNEETAAAIETACDLAVIPIPLHDPVAAAKPANKLLFFWRIGMPVLTSATGAYVEEMNAAGLDMTCSSEEEWERALRRYMTDADARREAGQAGRAYVERTYGEERALARWDGILAGAVRRFRGEQGA